MILQALKDYYDRKLEEGSITKDGWIAGGLDFLIDLDSGGNILGISDLRESQGRKRVSHPFELPNIGKQAVRHSNSGKDANLLWDNASFIFGLGKNGDLRLQSMIEAIDTWLGKTDDLGINAVKKFLMKGLENRDHFELALAHPEYGELLRTGSVKVSFRISQSGLPIVFTSSVVINALKQIYNYDEEAEELLTGTCLVTGNKNVVI